MLILAVSDFHGEIGWLPEAIDRLRPELLLSPGDWGDPGQLSGPDWDRILDQVPVLTVSGNHDDPEQLVELRNRDGTPVLLAQGEARKAAGLVVAGISGIWAKTRLGSRLNAQWEAARRHDPGLDLEGWLVGRPLPPYVTGAEVAALAAGLAGREVDILITHGCPIGLADRTPGGRPGGQRCFLELFQTVRPRLHLCGHLHAVQRRDLPDGRAVLNTGDGRRGDGWLIGWDNDTWEAEPLQG